MFVCPSQGSKQLEELVIFFSQLVSVCPSVTGIQATRKTQVVCVCKSVRLFVNNVVSLHVNKEN